MPCRPCCTKFLQHIVVFTLIASYWVFEAVFLMVWTSFGVGLSYAISYISDVTTSEKLSNAWQTYITIYVLACGVFMQTGCRLMFWEQVLVKIKDKMETFYMLTRILPLWILITVAFYELFVQFRLRFGKELLYDEENVVTLRFLLATCFLVYTLGSKVRLDYRQDQANSGVEFVCPGVIKYSAMFTFFYGLEVMLLFVWGFPVLLAAFVFRYFIFQEYIVYCGLILMGLLSAYGASGIQRGRRYRGPFSAEPMMPVIYAEVKTNVILFTILPMMTRWYFKIQFEYPDYAESNKVNFILFSMNVAFLLMYFVKQVLHYKFKIEDAVLVRIGRAATQEVHNQINNAEQQEIDNSSVSTGSYSWQTMSSSGNENQHHILKQGSTYNQCSIATTTDQEDFAENGSGHICQKCKNPHNSLSEQQVQNLDINMVVDHHACNSDTIIDTTEYKKRQRTTDFLLINHTRKLASEDNNNNNLKTDSKHANIKITPSGTKISKSLLNFETVQDKSIFNESVPFIPKNSKTFINIKEKCRPAKVENVTEDPSNSNSINNSSSCKEMSIILSKEDCQETPVVTVVQSQSRNNNTEDNIEYV